MGQTIGDKQKRTKLCLNSLSSMGFDNLRLTDIFSERLKRPTENGHSEGEARRISKLLKAATRRYFAFAEYDSRWFLSSRSTLKGVPLVLKSAEGSHGGESNTKFYQDSQR